MGPVGADIHHPLPRFFPLCSLLSPRVTKPEREQRNKADWCLTVVTKKLLLLV